MKKTDHFSTLSLVQVPILIVDPQERITFINQAAEPLFEDAHEALGKKLNQFVLQDHFDELYSESKELIHFKSAQAQHQSFNVSRSPFLDGSTIITLNPVHIPDESGLFLSSQTKFNKLFNNALLGIACCEIESGLWLDCNQALLNMLGYEKEELLTLTYSDITPEKYKESDEKEKAKTLANGVYGPYQKDFIRKDKNTIRVIMAGFTETLPNGKLAAWNHILDISQIDKSNQALQQAEERFKSYIENASDVFIILNAEGKYIYVAPSIKPLLGYEPDELLGRDNLDFMHPEDIGIVGETFEKALADMGSTQRSNFRALHKNGSWVWVEANGKFVHNYQGEVEAYITAREKQPSRKEIEERLRKLSLVADKTTNSVLITDDQRRIEWVNSSFTKFSGYTLQEVLGKRPEDILHGPESDKIYKDHIEGALASGKPFSAETVNYAKDGKMYWIETFVTPIFDANNNLTNYIAIESNINDRKAQERELKESLELSREQSRRLQDFAHIVSHNFRSHAANIIGLIKEMQVSEEQDDVLLNLLEQSGHKFMESLDELAAILQVQENRKLPLKPLVFNHFVNRAMEVLKPKLLQAEGQLINHIPEKAMVQFYPAYLESVFFNLISNAIKYRSPNRPLKIELTLKENKHSTEIQVADNGLGIDMEKHGHKIFQMYKTFHHHPDSQGVGLYLIKNQMTAMGGDITVKSAVDEGTCFRLIFPKS